MPNPSTLAMEEENGIPMPKTPVFQSISRLEYETLLEQTRIAQEFGKILQQIRDLLGVPAERGLIPVVEAMKQEIRVLKDLNHELHLEMQGLSESRDTIRAHAQAALNQYREGTTGSVCECCAVYECDCMQPDDI